MVTDANVLIHKLRLHENKPETLPFSLAEVKRSELGHKTDMNPYLARVIADLDSLKNNMTILDLFYIA